MNADRTKMSVQGGQMTLDVRPAARRLVLLLAMFCIGAALCGLARAQSYLTSVGQTSFTAPQPVELGFVETATGNLHLEIPLGSFRQRGMSQPLDVKLTYDSNIWTIYNNGLGGVQWEPNNKGTGWLMTPSLHSFGVGWGGDYCNNTDYNWTDPHGSLHYFPISTWSGHVSGCSNRNASGDAMAADSSGYHMYITNSGNSKVYASDGTLVYQFPYVQTGGNFHINVTDANGNYLQEDISGSSFYDTLGRSIVNGANGPTVPNSQGLTSNYVVTYASIGPKTNFQQSGVQECTPAICAISVIQSVTLPNSSGTYTFKYDCDQATSAACGSPTGQSTYYGTLISMTLPTGGVINYTYTTISDAYSGKARWLNTRSSGGSLWTYTMSVLSTCSPTQVGCQQKMVVVQPNGDTTVNTFTLNNGAWPVQIQQFKGSNTGGTLLSTTNNTFDFTNGCVITGCHGAGYIRKTAETVTVPIPGGTSITKKTTYSYDSKENGNITATKEWKFYAGTSPTYPTTPDRASFVTYYSAGNNIISKPLTTTLCNNSGSDTDCPGGGSKVAQTKVTYDSYGSGMTLVTGATGHDDANFGTSNTARGNPTQIQQWVTGTTYLTTTYQYDTTGQVLKITDPASNITTYGYADATSFFNDNGSNPPQPYSRPQLTNAYVTSVQRPPVGGVTMTESMGYYFGTGKLAIATDPNGANTYYHFMDPSDRSTQTNFPVGGSVTTYPSPAEADVYMPIGDLLPSSSCTSCRQNQFLYDSLGRKATQALANAPGGAIKTDTTYDANGRVLTVSHPYVNSSDPSHVFETLTYDALNRKLAVTHPDGQSSLMAYGANIIGLGGITTQQSSTATYGYGFPAISIDEAGKQSQHWVDGFGNVIEADEPSTNTSTPGSGSVTISFNSGQVSTTIDPCQPHSSCPTTVYNTGTISVTINGCTATTFWGPPPPNGTYSTTSIASALAPQLNGSSCLVGATANGSAITITALAGGSATNFSFTTSSTYAQYFTGAAFYPSPASGALTGGTGGISSSPLVTAYTYDVAGRVKQVVQGVQTRTFSYDGLGRPTSITTPEAGTDTLTYDSNSSCPTPNSFPGHLISKVDARGIRTCFQYDTLGRVTQKNYSNGQGSVTYQYDQGGAAAFALGRLTKMTDPSGSETYTYDTQGAGRITQVQKVIGSTTYTTGYGYNTAGQITGITYPSGRTVTQTLDNIGRLSSVADTKSGTNTTRASGYNYNNAQQVLNFTYGNTVLATFIYSSSTRDQMTSLSYAKGAQTLFSLGYYYQNDPNCTTGTAGNDGEINCINDGTDSGGVDAGRTVAYTYDALGRALTAVTHGSAAYPQWGLSWSYDRYGNRLSQTVTAGSGYPNSLSFANPGGAQTNHPDGMCFDASGNMTAESGSCPPASPMYSYDAENRMTGYSGSSAASYVYDNNGRRVKKCLPNCTSPTTTTVYVFSAGKDIAEYDNGAAPTSPSREYIYSGGRLITTLAGSSTTYHHIDHLSVRVNTDTNGNKIGEQGHYPYGELLYSANTTTKFIFTSYERDSESNNDYAMARYYRVGFGRFCSPDPLGGNPGDPQSWNRYVYARDNPINNVDPSGMSWLSVFINALANFFTGVNFGDMRTPPTFPTGNYDVWQKLEDAIIPPMTAGGTPPIFGLVGVGKKNPCSPFNLQNYDRIGNDGQTIRRHIERQHMADLANGQPNPEHVDNNGNLNGQYELDPAGTPDQNFGVIATYNAVTIAGNDWTEQNGNYVYTHTFTPAELFLISPDGPQPASTIGKGRFSVLNLLSILLRTATNTTVLNKNCQVVTSYPTW